MKRIGIVIFVLLAGSLTVWGAATQETTATAEPVTVKLLRMGTQDVWVNYVRGFIERFEEKYPPRDSGVRVRSVARSP